MCGLLAHVIISNGLSTLPVDRERFLKSLGRLRHRGPDEQGSWFSLNGNVGLGHQRLSLVGIENGHQPLINDKNDVVAIVNGEFYLHEEVKKKLIAKGHCFQTQSDSEILIHLYEEYQEKAIHHLDGDFAFVLWDQRRNKLWAARDRFGVKPLYYLYDKQRLLIASEIGALVESGVDSRWDSLSLEHAFTHQYLPPERTFFRDIQSLAPGQSLTHEGDRLVFSRYWALNTPPEQSFMRNHHLSHSDILALIKDGLTSAVQRRIPREVPVATALSGGLDSSIITALASVEIGPKLNSFGIRFDDPKYDEGDAAQLVAHHIGIDHQEVFVSRGDLLDNLDKAVKASAALTINGQLVAKWLLNRAIHLAGYKVVLTGEGADELFYGYSHLLLDHNPNSPTDHFTQGIMSLSKGNDLTVPGWEGFTPQFIKAKWNFCKHLQRWLDPQITKSWSSTDRFNDLQSRLNSSCHVANQPVESSRNQWSTLALSGYILRSLGDACEMNHSIEGRPPFLDYNFFESLKSIPFEKLFKDQDEKPLLRQAFNDILPKEIIKRRKRPLLAPSIIDPAFPELKTWVMDRLSSSTFRNIGFWDHKKVKTDIELLFEKQQGLEWDAPLHLLLSSISLQHSYRMSS